MHRFPRTSTSVLRALLAALALLLVAPASALAAPAGGGAAAAGLNLQVPVPGQDPGSTIGILALFTLLTLGPSLLIMTTGFARILIVLGFLRQAMGTPQTPPNQILVGFALFLTMFVMAPTFTKLNDDALQPYLAEKVTAQEALEKAQVPVRQFMIKQTGATELKLFVKLSRGETPRTADDVALTTLVPAFMLSEVKTAFQIGILIYIPFLIIDLVVASTLMSMGMMMLPPAMISLPLKLLLFVLVDGWALLTENLVAGFHL